MISWFRRAPTITHQTALQRATAEQLEFERTWPEPYDAIQRATAIAQRAQRILAAGAPK